MFGEAAKRCDQVVFSRCRSAAGGGHQHGRNTRSDAVNRALRFSTCLISQADGDANPESSDTVLSGQVRSMRRRITLQPDSPRVSQQEPNIQCIAAISARAPVRHQQHPSRGGTHSRVTAHTRRRSRPKVFRHSYTVTPIASDKRQTNACQ
jgi:hypothetical protein